LFEQVSKYLNGVVNNKKTSENWHIVDHLLRRYDRQMKAMCPREKEKAAESIDSPHYLIKETAAQSWWETNFFYGDNRVKHIVSFKEFSKKLIEVLKIKKEWQSATKKHVAFIVDFPKENLVTVWKFLFFCTIVWSLGGFKRKC